MERTSSVHELDVYPPTVLWVFAANSWRGPSTAATRAGATPSVAGVTGVVLAGANYQLEISGTASNLPRIHELWVH